MTNRAEFRHAVLARLGCYQLSAFRAFGAWEIAESGERPCNGHEQKGARWNVYNTTLPWPHATNYNEVPVRNYLSFADGVRATVATLKLPFYDDLRAVMLTDSVGMAKVLDAIAASPWGTTEADAAMGFTLYRAQPTYYNGLQIGT